MAIDSDARQYSCESSGVRQQRTEVGNARLPDLDSPNQVRSRTTGRDLGEVNHHTTGSVIFALQFRSTRWYLGAASDAHVRCPDPDLARSHTPFENREHREHCAISSLGRNRG